VKLGAEIPGDRFGRGLLRAAGVTGDTLDLSQKLGGDRPTVRRVLAAVVANAGELRMLNLSQCELDAEDARALAPALTKTTLARVSGGLTSIDLSQNQLCGISTDDNGHQQGTYTAEGIAAIADALGVNGALTSVNLRGNKLEDKGWGAIFAAICGNKGSKIMSLDASSENIGPAGVKLIAEALRTSVTGGLTSINLRCNKLRDEGWGDIFAAICGNKDSMIMSLDASSEIISPAGVKLISEALRTSVTGALTVTNLLGNQLDAESAKMLDEVAKQKGISLCGIQRDQTTADFRGKGDKGLKLPDAILLRSDLSQAVVTGGLTSLNLSSNNLCPVTETGYIKASQVQGSSFNEGDKVVYQGKEMIVSKAKDRHGEIRMTSLPDMSGLNALADAFRVNGGLTALDLSSNSLKDEGVSAVFEAIQINKETKLASLNMHANSIGPMGAKSVAAMVAVIGALTKLSLAWNKLGEEGTEAICEALKQNRTLKELDMSGRDNIGGEAGAKHVADMLGVNGGLTRLDVRQNKIAGNGAAQLAAAVLGNLKIEMFNEIPIKEMRADSFTELDLKLKNFGVEGGMVVAGLIPVMGALTQVLAF
jgi:hypothetical protein